jgi:hypothetical protein
VRKSINFCRTVRLEIFGLVENMSGLNCPHCGQVIDLFGAGGGDRTAREMNVAFLGRIPMDPRMVACGDSGVSFQKTYPDSAVTKAFSAIADQMAKLKVAG